MNWMKGFALVTCLAMPLSVIAAVGASAAPGASGTKIAAMTQGEKEAKSADCTKQADAKKLHGEARRKFRAECKKS